MRESLELTLNEECDPLNFDFDLSGLIIGSTPSLASRFGAVCAAFLDLSPPILSKVGKPKEVLLLLLDFGFFELLLAFATFEALVDEVARSRERADDDAIFFSFGLEKAVSKSKHSDTRGGPLVLSTIDFSVSTSTFEDVFWPKLSSTLFFKLSKLSIISTLDEYSIEYPSAFPEFVGIYDALVSQVNSLSTPNSFGIINQRLAESRVDVPSWALTASGPSSTMKIAELGAKDEDMTPPARLFAESPLEIDTEDSMPHG